MRIPVLVQKQPLKSIVHTSFTHRARLVAACNPSRCRLWVRLRVRPACFSHRPRVRSWGKRTLGYFMRSFPLSLRAPHVGNAPLSPSTRGSHCVLSPPPRFGLRERSRSPAQPSLRYRSTNLYTVCRVTPNRRATSLTLDPSFSSARISRLLCSCLDSSFHGIPTAKVSAMSCPTFVSDVLSPRPSRRTPS